MGSVVFVEISHDEPDLSGFMADLLTGQIYFVSNAMPPELKQNVIVSYFWDTCFLYPHGLRISQGFRHEKTNSAN